MTFKTISQCAPIYFEADTYQDDKRKKPQDMDEVFHLYEFTIHMIIEVQDNGKHNLKHYQRVIITVK